MLSGAPSLRALQAALWALIALAVLGSTLAFFGNPSLRSLAVVGGLLALGAGLWMQRHLGSRLVSSPAPPPEAPQAYQELIEQLPDPHVLCDAQGLHIQYANRAARALCGATDAREVMGRPLAAFMRPDEQEALADAMLHFLASDRTVGQPRRLHMVALDGAERTIETVAARVSVQGTPHLALTMWDVTTRERSEAHTAYLASFPELTPIPTLELDRKGQVVYANPAAHGAFPDLEAPDHPLLKHLEAFQRALARGVAMVEVRVAIEDRTYEARVYGVPGSENLRIYAQDVTLQQEAMLGLSESREKFSRVFMSSPVPLVVVRVRDGVFVDLNDAFVRLVGAETREHLIGRTPMDAGFWTSPHERRERLMLFRDLPIERRLTSFRRLDTGEQRRVELWADRIVVAGETCWAGVFLDVEAHLSAEEALQGERDFVQSLLDALGEGVVLADADDRFAYVNPAFERLIGREAAALTGQPILTLVEVSDRARYTRETERRRAGEASSYEVCFLHADGTPRPVLVTGVPIHAGRYAGGVAAVVTDLSALKAAQVEMQQQKEFYESVLAYLPLRVMVLDSEGRLAFANAEVVAEEAQRDRLLGKPVVAVMRAAGLSAEAAEQMLDHVLEARRTGRVQTWEEQAEIGGEARHLLFAVRPLEDPSASYVGYAVDVTEQRRADERAEAVKQFYERVLENIPVEVAVLDAEARVRYVNPASVRDPEMRAWMVGRNSVDYARARGLDTAPFEEREAWLQQVIATRAPSSFEERMTAPGKAPRTIVRYFTPILRDDGEVDYLIGYSIDLTERIEAEQQVEELKTFYEGVLDALPIEVAVLDPEGRVRYANPSGVHDPEARQGLLGKTTLEYAQWRGYDMALFAQREAWIRSVIASRAPSQYEERFDLPGRPVRTILRSLTPVLDEHGEVTYLIGHAVDLTERTEAQQRIETLKTFYESLLDTLPLEVAALDPDGKFRYLNPAALQDPELREFMIGRDSVEYAALRGLDPALYERRQAWVLDIVATREQRSLEETIARPGQPDRTILRVTRPILDEAGEVSFLVGYALDITEQHTYERGLVAAREQAEELARLKSSFLANMSHEIRTPLAGIIGFAEVLEDELEGAQREAASLVRESGMRLLDTLNSVLDLARLEAEATTLQLSPRDVAEEIHAAARLFAPTAARKGLAFKVRLPESGPPLVAHLDSAALHRVLANLVSNALKFTEAGGITLEAERADAEVRVHVRDTGSGMSESFLPHIFDEFRQESSGLTRTHQGSGLGLAITKRLVDLMHGTISVVSAPGEGSTFTVHLPAATPPPVAPAP